MDPENPVVKLCIAGMEAEGAGRADEARRLFQEAWDGSTDDWEAAVAAHYLARHQDTLHETRRWNQLALERATVVIDERTRPLLASLYLNLGKSLEDTGEPQRARDHYERGLAHLEGGEPGPLRSMIARGLEAGIQRVR